MSRRLAVLAVVLTLTACSSSGALAVVDGARVERSELEALHPADVSLDAAEQASSVFLLILHRVLTDAASSEFGISATEDEIAAAFQARAGSGADVDATLAQRGVTRRRVMLEAELDVVRSRVEEEMVRSGWPGVDLDKAYRDFLAVNSRVCLVVLTLADAGLADEVERRADQGEDLDAIFADHPDDTARIDMGCQSPLEHGTELASVALDGEVGRSYVRHPDAGGVYLAKVVSRDAPARGDVESEVLDVAIERQAPDLFNAWAADLLRNAEVRVASSVGRWEPVPESGDVPTVVAR